MTNSNAALSADQQTQILARLAEGESQKALATEFGVARSTIQRLQLANSAKTTKPSDGPETLLMLRSDQLIASPLNPRRSFDVDKIEELAESIAQNGLMQNLVVRNRLIRTEADGTKHFAEELFEIVAGERRARAIKLLVAQGRWPDDAKFPCRLIEADDPAHVALALVENLQRADLTPIEEAEALGKLHLSDPEKYSTAFIAKQINRSQRYVQQRLSLLKLSEMARTLLNDQRLTVEAARYLASMTEQEQIATLEDYVEFDDFEVLGVGDLERTAPISALRREADITRAFIHPVAPAAEAEDDDAPTLPLDLPNTHEPVAPDPPRLINTLGPPPITHEEPQADGGSKIVLPWSSTDCVVRDGFNAFKFSLTPLGLPTQLGVQLAQKIADWVNDYYDYYGETIGKGCGE